MLPLRICLFVVAFAGIMVLPTLFFTWPDNVAGARIYLNINDLPASTTASNFGKLADEATDKDVALAILNLVGQTIGILGIAAAHANNLETIILTGKLASIKPLKEIFNRVADLHKTKFIIPENADFATVIGAAITLANGDVK